MGVATEMFCSITFLGKTYNYLWEVENDIRNTEKALKRAVSYLRDMTMITEPDKLFAQNNSGGSIYELLSENFERNVECIKIYISKLDRLYILRDNWKYCHDKETGKAIPPPDNIKYNTVYLHGDYVRTVGEEDDED